MKPYTAAKPIEAHNIAKCPIAREYNPKSVHCNMEILVALLQIN